MDRKSGKENRSAANRGLSASTRPSRSAGVRSSRDQQELSNQQQQLLQQQGNTCVGPSGSTIVSGTAAPSRSLLATSLAVHGYERPGKLCISGHVTASMNEWVDKRRSSRPTTVDVDVPVTCVEGEAADLRCSLQTALARISDLESQLKAASASACKDAEARFAIYQSCNGTAELNRQLKQENDELLQTVYSEQKSRYSAELQNSAVNQHARATVGILQGRLNSANHDREILRKRIAQADADVDALGCMLKETKQVQGDRIVVLEKTVATLESENSGLQKLLRISIDDNAKMKAEKEAAVQQMEFTKTSTIDELQQLREGLVAAKAAQENAEATLRSAFEGQGVASGDAIMLQAVSTARDTQRQLAALRLQVIELTEQAQQLKLQEEVVVTRVRGEAALATTIMQEEAQKRIMAAEARACAAEANLRKHIVTKRPVSRQQHESS